MFVSKIKEINWLALTRLYVMREKNRCFLWRYYLAIEFKEEEEKTKS